MDISTEPPRDPDLVITAAGLRRSYGKPAFEAVRGIDLQVRRGELFALLGTNGAGKTSALEVIEGLAAPGAGTVAVLGLDPYADARRLRPHLGMMLQDGGFPAGLTVAETATMWAGTLTSSRPVDEALAEVRLSDRRNVVVRSLSGGERRRLDLALAIMGRPQVLFLDEPTTGLDPESRHEAWNLIGRLLAEGTTVLLTTHYLEEAERLADRIAIMHRGAIVQSGTLAEIVVGQPCRITFRTDPQVVVPELAGGRIEPDGPRWTVHTDRLQPTLMALLAWAARHDVVLHDLDARSASLEQAFLSVAQTADEPTSHALQEISA